MAKQDSNVAPLVFLAVAAGTIVFVATGIKAQVILEKLKIGVSDIKILPGTNILQTKLEFDLILDNREDLEVTFQRFDGDIIFKNQIITSFRIDQAIQIRKKDITRIQIPLLVSNLNLLASILDILITKAKAEVNIIGSMRANNINFPINKTVQLFRPPRF